MQKIRITDKRVADALAMRVLTDADYEEWIGDDAVRGFQVRITKTRKVLAYLQYWRCGKPKRLSLGEIGRADDGKMTVVEARKKASAARGAVDAGGDPAADRKRVRAESFEDAWKLFTASWSDEDRYRRECRALVQKDALPKLGSRPLAEITRRDIAPVVDAVTARSRSRAWELFKNLRLCFNWTVDSGLLEHSPMERMKPPKAVASRERLLNAKEIGAFWRASGQLEFPWQQTFRLLMLTACRRQEVGAMEWRELSGTPSNETQWIIPGSRTKNKKQHIVDLPIAAVEIIDSVPKMHDRDGKLQQLMFSKTGTTPPSGWGKPKKRLNDLMRDEIGEFEPFRLHDLRRTIVTTLNEEFDYTEELGERLLNHTKPGITKVYNKATLREKRKEALVKWSEYVLKTGGSV